MVMTEEVTADQEVQVVMVDDHTERDLEVEVTVVGEDPKVPRLSLRN